MKREQLYEQGVTAADDSEIAVILIKILGLGKPIRSAGKRGIVPEVFGG